MATCILFYLGGGETLEGNLQAEVVAKPKQSNSEQMRGQKSPCSRRCSVLNPTISLRLSALGATVDHGSKHKLEQGKIWIWTESTLPITGPETFLEISKNFLNMQIDWRKMCGEEKRKNHKVIPILLQYVFFLFSFSYCSFYIKFNLIFIFITFFSHFKHLIFK